METLAKAGQALDRAALLARFHANRARSAQIFGLAADALYERPIPLRHPFCFYQGHIPAFSYAVLCERGLGYPVIDPAFERLFERGIDPADAGQAQQHERERWPTQDDIAAFAARCDAAVVDAIANRTLESQDVPSMRGAQALFTILDHELMHQETLVYMLHRLDPQKKRYVAQRFEDSPPPVNDFVAIPAGRAQLGLDPRSREFGWDNEYAAFDVDVPAFHVQRYPVTNAEYLDFVQAGGPIPPFWIERNGTFCLRGAFEELPLPGSWPVYASNAQACAYAQHAGGRVMTEAEYHRAAFCAPDSSPRRHPWGDEPPQPHHGNFGFERYDPQPVDAHPRGASAWGIHDLVGNGWEWTSSPFLPFEGFAPMASYPRYSVDFFDGKHRVLKGASPVTARELIRPTLRNWFYEDYAYTYAKFRVVK